MARTGDELKDAARARALGINSEAEYLAEVAEFIKTGVTLAAWDRIGAELRGEVVPREVGPPGKA
jgi:hypothetical protein